MSHNNHNNQNAGSPSGADEGQLLKVLLAGEGIGAALGSVIRRRAATGPVPLSFAQERMWFIQQLEPASCVYHIQLLWRIRGPLDMVALEGAFGELVRRHESLRTTVAVCEGHPVQVIHDWQPVRLSLVDLVGMPEGELDGRVGEVVLEQANCPFNLTEGPLVRLGLVRVRADEHILSVTVHHMMADGWSCGILLREWGVLYEAFRRGGPSPLAGLPIQYADYAQWQRGWLQGPVLESQLAYWREQLAGIPAAMGLPTDYPPPSQPAHKGAIHILSLAPRLKEALSALSQREGVTLFMTLLAALNALLYRYTGQEDLVVGSPTAGRNQVETEGVVGLFVNTLVLRTKLSGRLSFRDVVQRVREVALEAYEHQDLPFEKLVEELRPERRLGYNPVFQVLFVFQNTPAGELNLGGLSCTPFHVDRKLTMFDLSLAVVEVGGRLDAEFEYSTELFEPATIERLAGHFRMLLEGIVADPDERIGLLPLLSAAERRQLLEEWNATGVEFERDCCLHELFERQVERSPEALAVVSESERISYRELNRRANQLAQFLRGCGVGADVLVGVCLERSVEMVVALLAVLKAGGAYVPIEPAHPVERLAWMAAECRMPLVLTRTDWGYKLSGIPCRVVCLDREWSAIARAAEAGGGVRCAPENLAYVIYTSGSTGRPKGSMIPHGAICNHMQWMQAAYPLTSSDAVLQKTPFSFDASVWEFYAPLLAGARLVVARPEGHLDWGYLVRTIRAQAISTLQMVPSLLWSLVEEPGFDQCQSLRRVFCGGETLSVELQERFHARLPGATLHNLYGPTETTIDATSWTCLPGRPAARVPVGKPVANVQAYIVDGHLEPVAVGVRGELLIGGRGLARGYVNRADLTAASFIPNPYGPTGGERLYRTGDRARFLPDGSIEFLGRLDQQVKLRGVRIELGEIEALLREHAAVRDCVVVDLEDGSGGKVLAAYVVPRQSPGPASADLQSYLSSRVPGYMVPSGFVFLKELPRTPNGKIDRRALPVPTQETMADGSDFVEPRTPFEQLVAQTWADLLGLTRVSVNADFFAVGGHSLLAIRVAFRLRQALQIEVPMQLLFRYPTVAGLAEALMELQLQNLPPGEMDRLLGEAQVTPSRPTGATPVTSPQDPQQPSA